METKENANNIEFSQDFSVPVDVLYEAWTTSEHLKQWWHPMGDSLSNVENDLSEGGTVSYEFEKKEFRVSGNYKQVQPSEKLVYTWNWEFFNDLPNEAYTLTITFESTGNGSILHVLQEGLPGEDKSLPHQDAWKTALESLKSHLEQTADQNGNAASPETRDNLKSDEGMTDRSGGYNELPDQAKVGGA
jgi:uncharacterized protein YndB with AHSA1/START domain